MVGVLVVLRTGHFSAGVVGSMGTNDCERSATQPFLDIHRCTWGRPGPVELGVFWGVVSLHITC